MRLLVGSVQSDIHVNWVHFTNGTQILTYWESGPGEEGSGV